MKPYQTTLMFGIIIFMMFACQPKHNSNTTEDGIAEAEMNESTGYDSLLAREYGADDYGMKKYVMAFLRRGPNRSLDSATAAQLQMAHMENIGRMAEAGKLVLAGPFFGDGDLRGIYIFDVQTIEEAEALTNSDPAILQGSLEMELLEWYGSAGLKAVNDIHIKIAKVDI